MVDEKALDEAFLMQAKKLKPKRHKPPKQISVNEDDLQKMILACETPLERALVIFLASIGLRASECCNVMLDNVDFERQTLVVQ